MYRLEREIILNTSADELWAFLATPLNLNEMTPPELDFKILSVLPEKMYNGLIITYQIGIPLLGTRRWLTEIKHVREGVSFVDEQRIGPYSFWYHEHVIEPAGDGTTRMIDRVSYQLPYGPVGALVHKVWVAKKLKEIFDYRARRLHELFGKKSSPEKGSQE